jgi:glycosyltransferase involved in cell wall biosynthesis
VKKTSLSFEGGDLLHGKMKHRESNKPLITVITSTFNAAKHLPAAIQSIREQNYRNIEYIVIDGASSDGTLDVLRANEDVIDYWVSEPDSGIYDAWNKGLSHCTGDWLYFLGADDFFWDENVLNEAANYLSTLPADKLIAYGKVFLIDFDGSNLQLIGKPWESVSKLFMEMMSLPHQGIFHRAELFKTFGKFNESFMIAGDYELLLRYLKSNNPIFFPNLIVAGMQLGGISNNPKNLMIAMKEFRRARKINDVSGFSFLWLYVILKVYARILLLSLIGQNRFMTVVKFFKHN